MSALFEIQLGSETLSPEELQQITGCARRADQIVWLNTEGWTHVRNRSGEPIVGRLYARMRLAGITPNSNLSSGAWTPDFSGLR